VDPRLGGPDRDTERIGNLGHGEAQVEVEDNRRSLLGLEPAEAAIELILIVDHAGVVSGSGLESNHPDLRRLPDAAPALIGAGVDDESVEPGVPALRIAQQRKSLPRSDQGVLDGVFRLVRVVQHEVREGVEPIVRGGRERLEGLVITLPCCVDEIALHRSLRLPGRQPLSTLHDGQANATVQESRRRRAVTRRVPTMTADETTPALDALAAAAVPHRVVRTRRAGSAEESAELQGIPLGALLRTIVVRRGDDDYLFVLVPAGRRFDWPRLRAHLGVRRLTLPDADEARAATGYERYTITPFGSTRAWPVILDAAAGDQPVLAIGGGGFGINVHLAPSDLVQALDAQIVEVSEPEA
jgi:Cys-tRNA(Pro) deacylase